MDESLCEMSECPLVPVTGFFPLTKPMALQGEFDVRNVVKEVRRNTFFFIGYNYHSYNSPDKKMLSIGTNEHLEH